MKLLGLLTVISLTLPTLISSNPATFDNNTRLWTLSDLFFAFRYDIVSPLILINLKCIEMQNLLGAFQAESINLKVLSSSAKSVYIARGNAFILDAYIYAMQNQLSTVASKLGPLNDLIQTSSDDAQTIAVAVGEKAVNVSQGILEQVLTEVVLYNQVIDEIFFILEHRTQDNQVNVSCINQGIYLVRDNTLEFYEKIISCLTDQEPTKKIYTQIETFFTEIERITVKSIKQCIDYSLQNRLSSLKSIEDEAYQCLGKILELKGHELIDAKAITDKTLKMQSNISDNISKCTSDITTQYTSKLHPILITVDSCLYGIEEISEDIMPVSDHVTPEQQGNFPYMFIDNIPIYSFNAKT